MSGKRMRRFSIGLLLICWTAFFSGCGSDGGSAGEPPAEPAAPGASGEQAAAETAWALQADYAADADPAAYADAFAVADELSADEYAMQILLTTDAPLTDFRYFVLESDDAGETIAFRAGPELYAADQLTADAPLLVWAAFPGVLPIRGLSFIDPNGQPHAYALAQSGEDGSLLLIEF